MNFIACSLRFVDCANNLSRQGGLPFYMVFKFVLRYSADRLGLGYTKSDDNYLDPYIVFVLRLD